MGNELVHVVVDGGVATVTLASPENRNALSQRLVADLGAALDVAEAGAGDGSVRAIVLTHVPPAFCAGADLKERRTGPPDSGPFVRVLQRLMDAEVPTIAAVAGPARAGGIGLMAACDLVVVHARRHVRPHRGAHRRRRRDHLGPDPAPGRPLGAHVGLPHRRAVRRRHAPATSGSSPTSPTTSTRTVAELCAGIRMGAPRAVAETKRMLREVPALERDDAFERMRQLSEELFSGPDAAEGMAAFAEKRPPSWQP